MGQRVPRVKTEVSESQMAAALIDAWKSLFGAVPSKEQVAMLLSQNALETGHRKAMWNFNVGNITTSPDTEYNYFDDLSADEQIKPGVWKKMKLKYRAYDSLQQGALDYLKFISSGRYGNAWKSILNPDPAAYAKALKQAGYYTGNESDYTKIMSGLFNNFNKSNSYEKAQSGSINPPSMVAKDDVKSNPSLVMDKITKWLSNISLASNKDTFLIKVGSTDYVEGIEFARIICQSLDVFGANAYTHTDDKNIEIQCEMSGDLLNNLNKLKTLCNNISSKFVYDSKNSELSINTSLYLKSSSLDQINLKSAEMNYRKFMLNKIAKEI